MDNKLFLFCGKSASGKSSIANILEDRYGMYQVSSYTTRPKRYDGEIGHRFVSDDEFDQLGKLVAYTEYSGFRYGVTADILDESDIYVIDPAGIDSLLKNMDECNRPICIIYFDAAVSTRIMRMVGRGAGDHEIISRLLTDDTTEDWYRTLDKLQWRYNNIENKQVELYKINANENIENVLAQVLYYMKKESE